MLDGLNGGIGQVPIAPAGCYRVIHIGLCAVREYEPGTCMDRVEPGLMSRCWAA